MTSEISQQPQKLGWRFPATFWHANGAELCERAAYYGMFITLFRYLNVDIGFTDPQTGAVTAAFAGGIYFLPTFMGIMADKVGFKQALILAFTLLTAGYGLLGAFQLKPTALIALFLIMCGGAIIKPVISGTVAKCSDSAHRARAMSIFYMVVNIGSFSGKGLAAELNPRLGMQYINFYAAAMTFVALLLIIVLYKNVDTAGTGKTVKEALQGLWKVMQHFRFLSLILIIAGFWLIQGQLYGAMPTFIERVLGKGYKPEWLANINPLTVVILVVPITHLVRHFRPENAIGIGLFIIPFTALVIALGPLLDSVTGGAIDLGLFSIHPMVMMIIIGIALQGLAECFLSPKFLEYASKQAPKGEVGLYLGYQHLTTFFAWLAGFIAAGLLLDGFCPDPRALEPQTRHEWRMATDPKYQFTLTAEQRPDLGDQIPIPTSIAQALRDHALELADNVTLAKLEPADSRKSDPARTWRIEEQLFTVREEWAAQRPWWALWRSPDALLITPDSSRWSGVPEEAARRFDLPGNLAGDLKHDAPVSEGLRRAFAQRGIDLPENASVRTERSADEEAGGRAWKLVIKHYSIEESKLETDAEARSDGREKALRDVLVYSNTARTPDEMPPLPDEYRHAHYIWYVFAAIGFAAFGALLVFKFVTNAIDRSRAITAGE
ncbi:MAG: MFS transporter [Planctomycetes bacterium]|nr:MFS transporter [Planctomycetota bacterium]